MGESMTDEQLLLISNLLHIVKEKDFSVGFFDLKNARERKTIGEMLDDLLEDGTLEKLRADTSEELYNGEISAQEWAAMLEQIQSDEQLCGMTDNIEAAVGKARYRFEESDVLLASRNFK